MCVTFDALSVNKLICSETLDGKNSCLFIDDETSNEKKKGVWWSFGILGVLASKCGGRGVDFSQRFHWNSEILC